MGLYAVCLLACLSLDLTVPKNDVFRLYSVENIVDAIGIPRLYSINKERLVANIRDAFAQDCLFCDEVPYERYDTVGYYYETEYTHSITVDKIYEHLSNSQIKKINKWLDTTVGKKLIASGGLATLLIKDSILDSHPYDRSFVHQQGVEHVVEALYSKRLLSEKGRLWDYSLNHDKYLEGIPSTLSSSSSKNTPINVSNRLMNLEAQYSKKISEMLPLYKQKLREFSSDELVELRKFIQLEYGYQLSIIYIETMTDIYEDAIVEALYARGMGETARISGKRLE